MSITLSLKDRISSPLEAGTSIADGHHLPSHLNAALDYVSKRLARKAAKFTLLVVRRDYQLPTSPLASPAFPPSSFNSPASASAPVSAASSAASTPARPTFALSAIKQQFFRSHNINVPSPSAEQGPSPIRERMVHVAQSLDQLRNGNVSPTFSEASVTSSISTVSTASSTAESTFSSHHNRLLRWGAPASPAAAAYGSVPMTPATPFTVASSSSAATDPDARSTASGAARAGSMNPYPDRQFSVKLVHVNPALSARDEKVLSQTIEKTARKFRLGPDWLPHAVSSSALGLTADLVHRSLAQNEKLFSSDSLILLSLDHLYTFRAALQSYARTQASCRLEDAVDELRRLILHNGRKKLLKSNLISAYRWLDPVSDSALSDVCRMYSRAYGGPNDSESGIENDVEPAPAWPLPNPEQQQQQQQKPPPPPPEISQTPPFVTPPTSPGTPQSRHESQATPQQAETPVLDYYLSAEDKEIMIDTEPAEDDDPEIDAIEAWYRDVQVDMTLDVNLNHNTRPVTTDIEREAEREMEMEEIRHLTPKMTPIPIVPAPKLSLPPASTGGGKFMALKLQTTFEKPTKFRPVPRRGVQQQQHQVTPLDRDGNDTEEELTARPRSAVCMVPPTPQMRWTNTLSIAEMMSGNGDGSSGSPQNYVGPMTPNGYDDISPITRGEWGLLMVGAKNGRTAAVEMC